ncbi:MAG TPA: response regulator [Deltaproteobacteria bacterium]|nr:response regulator [Deltaproteobacteria bacterium]
MSEVEKPYILIVDDRPENILALEKALGSLSLNIIKATSGNEALALILKYDFALVILDVQMPGMDGFETAELMRSVNETKHIPIIFATAISKEQKNIFKGYESGAVDYLFKPIEPEILRSKVTIFIDLYMQKRALEKTSADLRQTLKDLEKEISERKKAEEAIERYARDLELEKAYSDNIITSMIDLLLVADSQGLITIVNKAALDLLAYTEEELIGRPVGLLFDQEPLFESAGSGNVIEAGDLRDHDTTLLTKTGEKIPAMLSCSAMSDTADRSTDIVIIVRDMRESRLVQELEKANMELKEATSQLVQAEKMTALGELTASVAHELNQPLNGIKIISQSVLRDLEKNRFEEENIGNDLTDIVNLVNRMAEIIDHMRIFTRRTEGMSEEMIDINDVVKGPLKLMGQQLKSHNIDIVMDLTPDLPKFKGDSIRLEQVMMNLITNARGALQSSGKENMKIEIKTFQNNNPVTIIVEITDNGGGVPEDLREKIFQPFFTTKDPGKGTGLGLSVSSKIIEEHNGRIELDSAVGEGTTFRVMFPIAG